jgi:hypothetical protein
MAGGAFGRRGHRPLHLFAINRIAKNPFERIAKNPFERFFSRALERQFTA